MTPLPIPVPKPAPSPASSAFDSVLCVDDEVRFADSLRDLFRTTGRRAESAYDGHSAIRAIRESPFGVVLLDMRMPGYNGLDVLADLLEVRPELCVVLLTGYGEVPTAIECMQRGAAGMIEKKHTFDELLALVEHQHARHAELLRLRGIERELTRMELFRDLASAMNHKVKNSLKPVEHCFYRMGKVVDRLPHADAELMRDELVIGERCRKRIVHFLTRLNQFAQFDAFVPYPIELGPVIARGVRHAREHSAQAELAATVDLDSEKASRPGGPWVMGDDDLLSAAIEFLVQNAIDELIGMEPGGARRVELTAARASDRVVVTVADTGPGVSAEILAWLAVDAGHYSPPPREALPRVKSGTNFGIGLHSAAQVARACGGSLRATNRRSPDRGAIFTLELIPAVPPPPFGVL